MSVIDDWTEAVDVAGASAGMGSVWEADESDAS